MDKFVRKNQQKFISEDWTNILHPTQDKQTSLYFMFGINNSYYFTRTSKNNISSLAITSARFWEISEDWTNILHPTQDKQTSHYFMFGINNSYYFTRTSKNSMSSLAITSARFWEIFYIFLIINSRLIFF